MSNFSELQDLRRTNRALENMVYGLDLMQRAFGMIPDDVDPIADMDDDSDEPDLHEEARQQYEQDNLDAPAEIPEEPEYREELPTE